MKELLMIEKLVYRIHFQNEFLEDELQLLLGRVFSDPYIFPASEYNHLKQILFMISGIQKSSNFGYYFYEILQENPFPFCCEVLKSAVFNESYYNLNDKALKSYVKTYLIDSGYDSATILEFDKIIPEGHGHHYFETFASLDPGIYTHGLLVSPAFFDTMYAVINNDVFPMTQKKAAIIIAFLGLHQLQDAMAGKAFHILNLNKPGSDQILVLMHFIKSISILRHDSLSDELEKSLHEILSCRSNGDLPDKFDFLKAKFYNHTSNIWRALQTA